MWEAELVCDVLIRTRFPYPLEEHFPDIASSLILPPLSFVGKKKPRLNRPLSFVCEALFPLLRRDLDGQKGREVK